MIGNVLSWENCYVCIIPADILEQESMTSFSRGGYTNVQDVELPSIDQQPNSTLAVVGQLSMRDFLVP